MATIVAQVQPEFSDGVIMGILESPEIDEASGLVHSRNHDHVLWTHNDTYSLNRVFALDTRGRNLGEYYIDGVENRDWEDIAIGPGPEEGVDYLYVGEIGDNYAQYDLKYIYRIPEPDVQYDQSPEVNTLYDVETITYQYPDGARDSEAMFLDPRTKDLYIISKREFEDIRVYRAAYPQSTTEVITLDSVATLPLYLICGGDVSDSGLEIILKDYDFVYYWQRAEDQNLWEAFNSEAVILPYIREPQGEALCWAPGASGYFTTSELWYGSLGYLHYYPRLTPNPVVINEIMADPANVDDALGEWFEIHNNSNTEIDLNGMTIKDLVSDQHIINETLVIQPGEFAVLAANSDDNTNGQVQVDYQYDNFILDNEGDAILILSSAGSVMDSVVYENGRYTPGTEGVSRALLSPNMDNGDCMNWKEWDISDGSGDFGTPGHPNIIPTHELSILDIQYTEDPSGVSPYINQKVSFTGIMSSDPISDYVFFLQDISEMWSGICVRDSWQVLDLAKGDSVYIEGIVSETFGGITQLANTSEFTILKKAAELIVPVEVTTGEIATGGPHTEAYECVLVKVTGSCSTAESGYREWEVDDGSGPLRVYHPHFDLTPTLGETYEITGVLYYRLGVFKIYVADPDHVIINPTGTKDNGEAPARYELSQNYPNPFNPTTTISYSLPEQSTVRLKIFDIRGQEVATLQDDVKSPGNYEVQWDGINAVGLPVSTGVYFAHLQAGEYSQTIKMLYLK